MGRGIKLSESEVNQLDALRFRTDSADVFRNYAVTLTGYAEEALLGGAFPSCTYLSPRIRSEPIAICVATEEVFAHHGDTGSDATETRYLFMMTTTDRPSAEYCKEAIGTSSPQSTKSCGGARDVSTTRHQVPQAPS
jgi:hypothetical protein